MCSEKLYFRLFFVWLFCSLGCSSGEKYQQSLNHLKERNYTEATRLLQDLELASSKDQRLYVLELASAMHVARRFRESSEQLRKSEKLLEKTLGKKRVFTEREEFVGEGYEYFAANLLSMINFLLLGDMEGAIVDAKRMDRIVHKQQQTATFIPKQMFMMKYLSALAWESSKDYADAFIDYRAAYELNSDYGPLKSDILRTAYLSRRQADLEFWQKKFKREYKHRDEAQVVLIYEEGWAPQKKKHPDFKNRILIQENPTVTRGAIMDVGGLRFKAELTYDFSQVARSTVHSRWPSESLQKAKEIPFLGGLISLGNSVVEDVSQAAEMRYWRSLPARYYIARQVVRPGGYRVKIRGVHENNKATGEELTARIFVNQGDIAFINWRSFY